LSIYVYVYTQKLILFVLYTGKYKFWCRIEGVVTRQTSLCCDNTKERYGWSSLWGTI